MKRQYYDHRAICCEECAHYIPAGAREITGDRRKEGCGRFGYSLTGNYPEPADDCDGFRTPAQYAAELERKKQEKKTRKRQKAL